MMLTAYLSPQWYQKQMVHLGLTSYSTEYLFSDVDSNFRQERKIGKGKTSSVPTGKAITLIVLHCNRCALSRNLSFVVCSELAFQFEQGRICTAEYWKYYEIRPRNSPCYRSQSINVFSHACHGGFL